MTRRITLTDRPSKRVVLKDAATRRVSADNFGERIGAEVVEANSSERASPLSYVAVRDEIFHRLRSTGGRPGLEGVERKKIPLTHRDWKKVERVANDIARPGFHPSPGQVASILLSITLSKLNHAMAEEVKRT